MLDRRTIIAGLAGALPAAAIGAAPALASADAELIALGARLEEMLLRYFKSLAEWSPLRRAAHREIDSRLGRPGDEIFKDDPQWAVCQALTAEISEQTGEAAASDRVNELSYAMESVAAAIVDSPASSLGGLRAKALAVLYEARTVLLDHDGELYFHEDYDGGAARSLFDAVAALTGLTPIVEEIEAGLKAEVATREAEAA